MTKFETYLASFLVGLLVIPLSTKPSHAVEPPSIGGEEVRSSQSKGGLKAGDWLVHGRIIGTIPTNQSSRIGLIGGHLDTPSAVLPDADVSYFLADHFAVEGQAGVVRTSPKIRDSLAGDIAIGSIWNAAVAGIVQYHFLPNAVLNPYLGIGASATWPVAIDPARGIPNFKVKSQTSMLLQAGFDVHLTGRWFGNVVMKYILVPHQLYEVGGAKVQVDMNMLIVGAGIGYRF